ncbi:MAG: hypothetical protein H5U03_02005 [Clostridia bacterium]|nr:hypothetical protein [Clostridia bacterium]
MNTPEQLKLYILQGEAIKELLEKANRHGQHNERISRIEKKINAAKECMVAPDKIPVSKKSLPAF